MVVSQANQLRWTVHLDLNRLQQSAGAALARQGFLPGYHQPPNNSLPAYAQKGSVSRMARRNLRPWYIDPTPSYYGYDGDRHYSGRPGFYGGRYNGGSFGPCWTRTPIGPVWNCG